MEEIRIDPPDPRAAARFAAERIGYAEAKSAFIDAVVARAGGPARRPVT